MVNTSNKQDLADLRGVIDILTRILENPDKYEVVNFEAEKGTSRTQVTDDVDHAMQRVGVSVTYVTRDE